MKTLKLLLLRWLQKQCAHPDYAVKADILEGGFGEDNAVQWCEACGAFRLRHVSAFGLWREPRPDWHTAKERKQYLEDLRDAR